MFRVTFLVLSCGVSSEIIMLLDFKTKIASNQQPNLVPRLPSYSIPEIASNAIFSVDAL